MPTIVVEQRRNLIKRPLNLLLDPNYHKPLAAPLYELREKSPRSLDDLMREWADRIRREMGNVC
jgi:hypothetical protein